MEKLYNNIVLPEVWPPKDTDIFSGEPIPAPYLENKPDIIDITVGRQLFVDDFLIEKTGLVSACHKPVKYRDNPIMKAETHLERDFSLPCACPKSGGVWYDDKYGKYRMWYEAGWLHRMAYAESDDGLNWTRPVLDITGEDNQIFPDVVADSSTVFIDPDTKNPNERYKLFLRDPGATKPGYASVSADGIHWSEPVMTGDLQDRSTIFYNPFRKKWVYSIRMFKKVCGRVRYYRECDDYLAGAKWAPFADGSESEAVKWMSVDKLDLPDPAIGDKPQLYNFDAVAYESIMLGMFQIHKGPDNRVCETTGIPKITELIAAYSRDGFHFTRPDRTPFIEASRTNGSWDRGYVQSVGGILTVHGDELWIYYIGFAGDEGRTEPLGKLNGMHDNSATGIAKLRRDGFVSMDGSGELLTRKLTVSAEKKRLFINARGKIVAELLDADGNALPGFSAECCRGFDGDSTKAELKFSGGLPDFGKKPFRVRFIAENASFYAFWFE